MIIATILFTTLWFIYACLEGKRDAYFFFLRNGASVDDLADIRKDIKNIHSLYTAQRSVVAICIVLGYCYAIDVFNVYEIATLSLSMVLTFSFWHNGTYLSKRNDLDYSVYPKRFWDESTTSTSITELNLWQRLLALVIGLCMLIFKNQILKLIDMADYKLVDIGLAVIFVALAYPVVKFLYTSIFNKK